ncbi:hypothetical protein [Acinetobacter wuhouensis]|uniref:Uncharacterized protein n=1 Tax=Acinetobacter wuhouensis TaxID=1879050 RepID=A0A4Q7AJU2_9GAMM|nr:hypothetical protein [Acinetobacter wuhouensis]RZG47038.1 hypothetical protein EXU28_07575 [Acinetobacter wuhouensis]
MNQGIPSRDVLVDRNGQMTTIWLIFFERLYSVYSDSSQSNFEAIAQIKDIAEKAHKLATQVQNTNASQQKQIDDLFKQITDSSKDYATSQDIYVVNKSIEQVEYDLQQLQLAFDQLRKTFGEGQKEIVDKFSNLQDQVNTLAKSTFIDAPEDGKIYGRQDANWKEIVAVKLSLPFFLSDGTQQNLALTSDYQLPFFLSNGLQQNIQMVII